MYICAQIFGFLALIACIVQFCSKTKKVYILFGILINLLLGIEYLFLGTFSGAYLCLFAVFRCIVYLFKGKNKFFSGIHIPIFFVLCNILIEVFTFKNWFDILPAISAISVSLYPWSDNIKFIKICTLFIGPLWITYDILVGAWVSMIMEIVELVGKFIIFFTLLHKEKMQKQNSQQTLQTASAEQITEKNE